MYRNREHGSYFNEFATCLVDVLNIRHHVQYTVYYYFFIFALLIRHPIGKHLPCQLEKQ